MSISRHEGFRFLTLIREMSSYLECNPYRSNCRKHLERLPDDLRLFLPESFDRESFLKYNIPLDICGAMWSDQVIASFHELEKMPKSRVLHVSYDRFCENPVEQLAGIMNFMEIEHERGWLDQATRDVRLNSSKWQKLPVEQYQGLMDACDPGMKAIEDHMNAGLVL